MHHEKIAFSDFFVILRKGSRGKTGAVFGRRGLGARARRQLAADAPVLKFDFL
ncbi:hypothetical protein HRI96_02705 [Treponema parvum]|uniref:Uncharacterized protein n=1 Tax=Treponema parvum TaxID=138851 RepID=A0A975EYU6_9SPIR|nr:hypothetical protein [Treponema parvum]QTQ11200.1 hypothetical protein HRI96_02705 [Treponema parvum]